MLFRQTLPAKVALIQARAGGGGVAKRDSERLTLSQRIRLAALLEKKNKKQ